MLANCWHFGAERSLSACTSLTWTTNCAGYPLPRKVRRPLFCTGMPSSATISSPWPWVAIVYTFPRVARELPLITSACYDYILANRFRSFYVFPLLGCALCGPCTCYALINFVTLFLVLFSLKFTIFPVRAPMLLRVIHEYFFLKYARIV
jgi:hypothetical protein